MLSRQLTSSVVHVSRNKGYKIILCEDMVGNKIDTCWGWRLGSSCHVFVRCFLRILLVEQHGVMISAARCKAMSVHQTSLGSLTRDRFWRDNSSDLNPTYPCGRFPVR